MNNFYSGQFDRAFIVLHGRGGEDGEIQGFLQAVNLPYTGSGVAASVLSMNKRISKNNWIQQGLPTAGFARVSADSDAGMLVSRLGLPLIIKPVNEGSSIGMSKVKTVDELKQAIELAAYSWADLVICRAGALTVAEVAAAGVASILVPYPYAVDDHQTHNAALLVDAGAATLIADDQLKADALSVSLRQFDQDREGLLTMANAARQVAKIGSATRIADLCLEYAHG